MFLKMFLGGVHPPSQFPNADPSLPTCMFSKLSLSVQPTAIQTENDCITLIDKMVCALFLFNQSFTCRVSLIKPLNA